MTRPTSRIRRALRRTGRALVCAGAVAGGAGVAAATAPTPAARVSPVVEAMAPYVAEDPILTTAAAPRALEPAPPRPDRVPETVEVPTIPLRPFAERLKEGRIITGATPHRLILFTFDDGPDPRNTPRLLDILDEHGVKAVFFLTASRLGGNGPWQRRNQAIARDIVARGHIVGNHTLEHPQLPLLNDEQVLAQVAEADAIFEDVLGERTWLVRPPGGAHSARVDTLLADRGYTQMLWNLGTGDFQVREPEEVFRVWRRVLERRERESSERGGIVLLHDTHEWSVDAVPRMISWIREQNCALLEAGEELYDITGDPTPFFSPRGDASPSEEAPPARLSARSLQARQARIREETERRCRRLASR